MNAPLNPRLSSHFSLAEAMYSDTAQRLHINNEPPPVVMATMQAAARELEIVRTMLGKPIIINSWYRSLQLNKAIGSKNTSQHLKGEAIDFRCPEYGSPLAICRLLNSNAGHIPFDQLILEHTWVHISFAILSGKPRRQVLSLTNGGHYALGLTNANGTPY